MIPAGQLGLSETQLQGQPITHGQNATQTGPGADINLVNGTVVNGGSADVGGTGWGPTLEKQLANRYYASTLCSWWVLPSLGMLRDYPYLRVSLYRYATGGSIPGVLPRLSDAELNVTSSIESSGHVSALLCHAEGELTLGPYSSH